MDDRGVRKSERRETEIAVVHRLLVDDAGAARHQRVDHGDVIAADPFEGLGTGYSIRFQKLPGRQRSVSLPAVGVPEDRIAQVGKLAGARHIVDPGKDLFDQGRAAPGQAEHEDRLAALEPRP